MTLYPLSIRYSSDKNQSSKGGNKLELWIYDDEKKAIKHLKTRPKGGERPHMPYFLTTTAAKPTRGVKYETVRKFHPFLQRLISMNKVIVNHPIDVHRLTNSDTSKFKEYGVWENKIDYLFCYLFDKDIRMGMPYEIKNKSLSRLPVDISSVPTNLRSDDIHRYFAELLFADIPMLPSTAFDIEVQENGEIDVISFADSEGNMALFYTGDEIADVYNDFTLYHCKDEQELLLKSEKYYNDMGYMILYSFNGIRYDLRVIYERCILYDDRWTWGIERIEKRRGQVVFYRLKKHIHIDLYKYYNNRAIWVYTYGKAYRGFGLDAISSALLGRGKLYDKPPDRNKNPEEYIKYAMLDSEITMGLVAKDDYLAYKLMFFMCRISSAPLEECINQPESRTAGVTYWLKWLIYKIHRMRNILVPNKADLTSKIGSITDSSTKKQYKGATVIEPTPGIFFGAVSVDFASLYPTIIERYNLSYETVGCGHNDCKMDSMQHVKQTGRWACKVKMKSCDHPECKDNKKGTIRVDRWVCKYDNSISDGPTKKHPKVQVQNGSWLSLKTLDNCEHPECKQDISGHKIIKMHICLSEENCEHPECSMDNRLYAPGYGHYVCKHVNGILSNIVGGLKDMRVKYFKKRSQGTDPVTGEKLSEKERNIAHVIQQTLKVCINGYYGATGYPAFPFFQIGVAESTTALGRSAIMSLKNYIEEEHGVRVIYGDTDSCYTEHLTDEAVEDIVNWSIEELLLELEKEHDFIWIALSDRKKNYMGLTSKGKMYIKGLSGKKSDTPPFIRKAFQDIIENGKTRKTKEDLDEYKDYIKDVFLCLVKDIQEDNIPVDKMAFTSTLSKDIEEYDSTPQNVRVAKMLQDAQKQGVLDLDIEYGRDSIVSYIKVMEGDGWDDNVVPVQLFDKNIHRISHDRYIEKALKVFIQIAESFGISESELNGQTSLEDFF